MQYQGGKNSISSDIANIISGGGYNQHNEISGWKIENSKRNIRNYNEGGATQ